MVITNLKIIQTSKQPKKMNSLTRDEILSIKKITLDYFQTASKSPSDILINDLQHSFFSAHFGKILLPILMEMTKPENHNLFATLLGYQDKFKPNDEGIAQGFEVLQNGQLRIPLVRNKQDMMQFVNLLIVTENSINENFLSKYIQKWNAFEKLVRVLEFQDTFTQQFKSLATTQLCKKNTQVLALLALKRFELQNPNIGLQDLWFLTFGENFPKNQKLKGIDRKVRTFKKVPSPELDNHLEQIKLKLESLNQQKLQNQIKELQFRMGNDDKQENNNIQQDSKSTSNESISNSSTLNISQELKKQSNQRPLHESNEPILFQSIFPMNPIPVQKYSLYQIQEMEVILQQYYGQQNTSMQLINSIESKCRDIDQENQIFLMDNSDDVDIFQD